MLCTLGCIGSTESILCAHNWRKWLAQQTVQGKHGTTQHLACLDRTSSIAKAAGSCLHSAYWPQAACRLHKLAQQRAHLPLNPYLGFDNFPIIWRLHPCLLHRFHHCPAVLPGPAAAAASQKGTATFRKTVFFFGSSSPLCCRPCRGCRRLLGRVFSLYTFLRWRRCLASRA